MPESPIPKKDSTITEKELPIEGNFTLTNLLRWKQSSMPYIIPDTLQQLWIGSNGTKQWKDVPTETE